MGENADRRWYHCIMTTYGAWLPGDPRGFRTRQHREHVEGDYKRPPPEGMYAARHARAKGLQKHSTVTLGVPERKLLGVECVRQFKLQSIEAITLAVGGQHVHLQMRCEKSSVIATLGVLKRAMWYARKQAGNGARLWGRGRKIVPIESRRHQESVFGYVLEHVKEGAWVWSFRDGFDVD